MESVNVMGREVRRVPADWQHPEGKCLLDGYARRVREWDEQSAQWERGLVTDYRGGWQPKKEHHAGQTFVQWGGKRPDPDNYMPEWPEAERTHYQMYETCTEGSPISPVCASPEELARWLADNGASASGRLTATYEQWLGMILGPGWAPTLVRDENGLRSGVEAVQ